MKELWLGGPDDRLRAREQAKAWALREVWKKTMKTDYGMNEFVASRVTKNKNGVPGGPRPSRAAMKEFFEKIDGDREWYPGKHNGAKRGPSRILVGVKKTAAVPAAQRIQLEEEEVTYSDVVSAAPKAVRNPATGEPVSPPMIYRMMREECYDDSDNPLLNRDS